MVIEITKPALSDAAKSEIDELTGIILVNFMVIYRTKVIESNMLLNNDYKKWYDEQLQTQDSDVAVYEYAWNKITSMYTGWEILQMEEAIKNKKVVDSLNPETKKGIFRSPF